jgi:hypothetical protein
LKWKVLDPLEGFLMVMCGVSIFMFTLTVLLDVITRTIGLPWLVAAAGDHRVLRLGRVHRHGRGHPGATITST